MIKTFPVIPRMAGVGCAAGCAGCSNAGKCAGAHPAGLGFAYNGGDPSTGSTASGGPFDVLKSLDWKIWALLIAVIWIIAQNVFFTPAKVTARQARRRQIKAIQRRYSDELRKAQEAD